MKALRSPVVVQSRTSVAVALSPIIRTDSGEKDATEPVQFGTEIGLRRSFASFGKKQRMLSFWQALDGSFWKETLNFGQRKK
jgi:hypothetical protein